MPDFRIWSTRQVCGKLLGSRWSARRQATRHLLWPHWLVPASSKCAQAPHTWLSLGSTERCRIGWPISVHLCHLFSDGNLRLSYAFPERGSDWFWHVLLVCDRARVEAAHCLNSSSVNLRMPLKLTGLWHHADFLRLWSGQTLSVFGSMIGATAMIFTATLFLHATPFQMGVLNATQVAPAFLGGLFAGAWVDRVRRRPLLIGTDLGRALVLSCIPLAALAGRLHIELLYLVALVVSLLTVVFDVAYQSYLPGLVGKNDLVEGNSKLSASAAAAQFGGFSIAGWLVQALTAPFAILIDAGSFVVSASTFGLIRAREPAIVPVVQPDMPREIVEGLKVVWRTPLLRASALATAIFGLDRGIFGALAVLYMSRDLGFSPGILSLIWAVGGISTFMGAAATPSSLGVSAPARQ